MIQPTDALNTPKTSESVTDADIERAERTIAAARAKLEEVQAEHQRRLDEQQKLLAKVDAAAADVTRLNARRQELLPRLGDDDPSAVTQELRELAVAIEKAQQLASDLRDAAELLTPGILEMNPSIDAARLALREAEYRVPYLQHVRKTEELEQLLALVSAMVQQWMASGEALEVAYRRLVNAASPLDGIHLQIARKLSLWARDVLGAPHGELVSRAWPPETGALMKQIRQVSPEIAAAHARERNTPQST